MDEINMKPSVGKKIRELRQRLGYSQEELGFAAGVTQGAIGHIENGHKQPSLRLAVRLATALEVTVDELLSDCEPLEEVDCAAS